MTLVVIDRLMGVMVFRAAISFLIFSTMAWGGEHIDLPQGFRWCVSTSAHQIEGGNFSSDLWDWEQVPGRVRNGDSSRVACDHWNRVSEDVGLLKSLNVKTYRFSVEWAKIEPEEGVYDEGAIAHYRDEVRQLQAAGIEPMITLHHFSFPRWVRAKGGWEWEWAPEAFEKYAEVVYERIGQGARDWLTINEPMVHVAGGYLAGVMPPMEKRPLQGIVPVLIGMLKAHARAYHALHRLARAVGQPVRVGLAHHLRTFDPASKWSPLDHLAAKLSDDAWNWAFPNAVTTGRLKLGFLWFLRADERIEGLEGTQDFFGVNYYTGDLIGFSFKTGIRQLTRKGLPKNDMGWDIYPEGFHRVLAETARRYPGLPVMITENGTADAADRFRPAYLVDHLTQVARAIGEGVPVEGYCYWSLLDNFEWNSGYYPRFGLFEMNYSTLSRKARPSAELFSRIARENGL